MGQVDSKVPEGTNQPVVAWTKRRVCSLKVDRMSGGYNAWLGLKMVSFLPMRAQALRCVRGEA